jgi:hypothetical protein
LRCASVRSSYQRSRSSEQSTHVLALTSSPATLCQPSLQ